MKLTPMIRASLVALCALLLPLAAGTTSAASMNVTWPQFRYDAAHDGFNSSETSIGIGNVSRLKQIWHWGTAGTYTDPVVTNGSVFLATRSSGRCSGLEAVNAATGHPQWHKSISAFQCVDPAITGKTIVLLARNPWKLYAWNTTNGALEWSRSLPPSRFMAPTVNGGVLYVVSPSGYIRAMNPSNGKSEWTTNLGAALADYTPAISGGKMYVTSTSGTVYAVGLNHGHLNWKAASGVAADTQDSTVAVADGMLIVSSNINVMYAVNLAHQGKVVWKATGMEFTPEFSVAYHTVYLATPPQGPHGQGPSLFALNDQTGKVKWQFSTGYVGINPSVANGVVYVSADGPVSTNGALFAVNAVTGKKLWTGPGAGTYPTYPSVVNGTVYVGNYAWTVPGGGS